MSTLETQLNYLYSIKRAIGRAIANKGVNITDSDTFYSYAEKIRQIAGDDVVIKSELTPADSLEVSFLETYNSTPADNLDLSVVFLEASENVSETVSFDYGNAFARHINISSVNHYDFDDDWVEFTRDGITIKQRTVVLQANIDVIDGREIAYIPVPIGTGYEAGVANISFRWEWE